MDPLNQQPYYCSKLEGTSELHSWLDKLSGHLLPLILQKLLSLYESSHLCFLFLSLASALLWLLSGQTKLAWLLDKEPEEDKDLKFKSQFTTKRKTSLHLISAYQLTITSRHLFCLWPAEPKFLGGVLPNFKLL